LPERIANGAVLDVHPAYFLGCIPTDACVVSVRTMKNELKVFGD
jgi:hypothetical protein